MSNLEEHERHDHGEFTIIVNARQKTISQSELTFDEVVTLAFGPPNYETNGYTVTCHKGEEDKAKGSLVRDESVHIKPRMVFDVIRTES